MNTNKLTSPPRTINGTPSQLPRKRKSLGSSFGSLIALAALGVLLGGQYNAAAWDVYSDNFNDGNDTLPAPAWLHYDPIHSVVPLYLNTYTCPVDPAGGNNYNLHAPPSPNPGGVGPARTIAYRPDNYTNFNITADLMPGWAGGGANGSYVQAMGLVARLNNIGIGQLNGYAFVYINCDQSAPRPFTHNALAIFRIDHENEVDVPGSGNGGPGQCYLRNLAVNFLDNSLAYRFQFIGKGTHLEGRVYALSDTNTPLAVLDADTAGDSVTWTNGPCGIIGVNFNDGNGNYQAGPVDMTWDNYTASIHSPYEIRDDFDRGNAGAQTYPPWSAPAWVPEDPLAATPLYPAVYTGATFAFPGGNTYQMTSPQLDPIYGAGNPRVFPLREEVQYTDFYVAADMINWDTAHHQEFGIGARVANVGPGTTSGYLFGWENGNLSPTDGDLDVLRIIDEGQTDATQMEHAVPNQNSGIHLNAGTHYRFTLSCKGADLRAKVFELPNISTPVKDLLALDVTWPGNVTRGYSGVFVFNHPSDPAGNACTVTVDNFYADTAEPAIAISTNALGQAVLTWPANLASIWTLETSSSVAPGAVWTKVSGDAAKAISYSSATGMNTYMEATSVSATTSMFFRLQRIDPIAYP